MIIGLPQPVSSNCLSLNFPNYTSLQTLFPPPPQILIQTLNHHVSTLPIAYGIAQISQAGILTRFSPTSIKPANTRRKWGDRDRMMQHVAIWSNICFFRYQHCWVYELSFGLLCFSTHRQSHLTLVRMVCSYLSHILFTLVYYSASPSVL